MEGVSSRGPFHLHYIYVGSLIVEPPQMPFVPLYIDGQWRPASTDETFEVRNPQSNKVVGTSASASSQDCKDAVEAAAKAFTTWEHVSLSQRRDIFIKAADILRDKYKDKVSAAVADEIAATSWVHIDLMVSTAGLYHLDMFNLESKSSDRNLRFIASSVNELNGEAIPSFLPGAHTFVQRRPHGVMYVN
jgi:acyl-CoA reductase-like NAD-dependent aldehyde dehydrogenase